MLAGGAAAALAKTEGAVTELTVLSISTLLASCWVCGPLLTTSPMHASTCRLLHNAVAASGSASESFLGHPLRVPKEGTALPSQLHELHVLMPALAGHCTFHMSRTLARDHDGQ